MLEWLSARFKSQTLGKPRVVAILPAMIASCQINIVKPLNALKRRNLIDFSYVLESNATVKHVERADVVVFCRNTEPQFNFLLLDALGRRKKIIYDLDDSLWDVPETTDPDLSRYHRQPFRLRQLEQYLQFAHLVRVYSPLLQTRVSELNDRTRLRRSGLDFSLITETSPTDDNGRIKIVYATSRTLDDQYKLFLPALLRLLDKNPEKVEVTIWGCDPPELRNLPSVSTRPLRSDYSSFLKSFSEGGFHIGLAPLDGSFFSQCKNNTKFRDYGACGIAGIYSRVPVYSSTVEDGVSGLLADNDSQSWFHAIESLVANDVLRRSIAVAANRHVYEQYRQELIEDVWMEDIEELVGRDSFIHAGSQHLPPVKRLLGSRQIPGSIPMISLKEKATANRLSGVEISGDEGISGKCWLMEVTTEEGVLIREKLDVYVTTQPVAQHGAQHGTQHGTRNGTRNGKGRLVCSFEPIVNSRQQVFDFRLYQLSQAHSVDSTDPVRPSLSKLREIKIKLLYDADNCPKEKRDVEKESVAQSLSHENSPEPMEVGMEKIH